VQGVTEWLPVSSSAHLALIQNFWKIDSPILLDAVLHFGTLVVIFIFFWKDIIKVLSDWNKLLNVIIAVVPILLIGFIFRDFIENSFNNVSLISVLLIVNGIILFSTRFFKEGKKHVTIGKSLIIGLFQAIAVLPGISRSGSTISSGVFCGIRKEEVISFSFIIGIVPILGANILALAQTQTVPDLIPYVAGFIVSLVIGYISLTLLIKLVKRNKLQYFSYYCFALGILVLIFSLMFP
jgi:undecaprenyl-diphosphatase